MGEGGCIRDHPPRNLRLNTKHLRYLDLDLIRLCWSCVKLFASNPGHRAQSTPPLARSIDRSTCRSLYRTRRSTDGRPPQLDRGTNGCTECKFVSNGPLVLLYPQGRPFFLFMQGPIACQATFSVALPTKACTRHALFSCDE